jgi:hypothetical protein
MYLQGEREMNSENSSEEERPEDVLDKESELAARREKEKLVEKRMQKLWKLQVVWSTKAHNFNRYSTLVKVSVIILGALVATKEAISMAAGISNQISIVGYALAGALIAVLTGLEVAFGWGTKSGKLAALAVTCRETRQQAELDLINIASQVNTDANLALDELVKRLTIKLQGVQSAAIELGMDPVFEAPSQLS